jgi:hypothetical protein
LNWLGPIDKILTTKEKMEKKKDKKEEIEAL